MPIIPDPPPFFEHFGTGFVAPVIKSKAKYRLSDRPQDGDVPTVAGIRRKKPDAGGNILRHTPAAEQPKRTRPQPTEPKVPESYVIADEDDRADARKKTVASMGLRFMGQLAMRMAAAKKNRKQKALTDELFGDDDDEPPAPPPPPPPGKKKKQYVPVTKPKVAPVKQRALKAPIVNSKTRYDARHMAQQIVV